MKELAKSVISFSCAVGMVGARRLASIARREERKEVLPESESVSTMSTERAVRSLGREGRENYRFVDEFQRGMIDCGASLVAPLASAPLNFLRRRVKEIQTGVRNS